MISNLIFLSLVACAQADFESPLLQAINRGSRSEVKELSKNRSELMKRDAAGFDALFHAVSLNELETVKILVAAGAPTRELYGENKESLLFEATRLGSLPILKYLLNKDSQLLKLKNRNSESPLFEAVRSNQSSVVEFFVKKGLSLKEKNDQGKVPDDFLSPANEKMRITLKKLSK